MVSKRFGPIKIVKTKISAQRLAKTLPVGTIIAVGGDGTFLKAFKKSAQTGKPVLCIRAHGSKGVLAEGNISEIRQMEKKLKKQDFPIIKYPMLEGGTENKKLNGFNEIGFFRTSEEALRFDLFINGVLFYKNVVADGGIVSTPAGSTAYNVSAGGPVLDLMSKSLVFTPLNPHGLNKPVVFEGSAKIVFHRHSAHAFADGKRFSKIKKYLEITKSAKHAKIISLKIPFHTRWQRIVGT
ncbi:MAG: NAD(+)/NADH kinase [Candidatus Aenigmarchaeota archaeon]|nr:NAD(+)/NADH kinase [Candidatus Aenigmarchaeota archaeon]